MLPSSRASLPLWPLMGSASPGPKAPLPPSLPPHPAELYARRRSESGVSAVVLKQALDERKMQVMNDLNQVHRLVAAARLDHYALFQAHRLLLDSHNEDVLLLLLLRDAQRGADTGPSEEQEGTREVLETIFDFQLEQQGRR